MDRRANIGRQRDVTTKNKSSGVGPGATGSLSCYPIDPHVLSKASAKHYLFLRHFLQQIKVHAVSRGCTAAQLLEHATEEPSLPEAELGWSFLLRVGACPE